MIMTIEEIKKYAEKPTENYFKTIITLKNGAEIFGYFDENHDDELKNKNLWNFVTTPVVDENDKIKLLDGEDFLEIRIERFM